MFNSKLPPIDPLPIATVTSYSAGGASIASWFAGVDWLPVIGMIVVAGTFLVNWYYNRSKKQFAAAEDARRQERHELEMTNLRELMSKEREQRRRSTD